MSKIEVFKGKRYWYYHIVAGNGQVLSVSEGYVSKGNATRAVDDLIDFYKELAESNITVPDDADK